MNEPGTSPSLRSHVTALDRYTKEGQNILGAAGIKGGITLGLATLMDAPDIFCW